MKLIALLSWYDENPLWLERCVRSLVFAGVDELVAVDGAYGLYPNGKARSDEGQAAAIERAADAVGIAHHIGIPEEIWDTEIQKRNWLFRWAEDFCESDDWYMVIDADEFVTEAPEGLKDNLANTMFDVGAIRLNEPGHPRGTITYDTFPMFFKAITGLRVVGNHFTYMTPDGRYLWGDVTRNPLQPRQPTGVTVEHHREFREPERRKAAVDYYDARDEARLEVLVAGRYLITEEHMAQGIRP